MFKLIGFLKKRAGYVLLIFGLLILQAYCDLALPDYTSNIVNVGIQQHGILDAVPNRVRPETLDHLTLFMSEEDAAQVRSLYETDDDGNLSLTDLQKEDRSDLSDLLTLPEVVLTMMTGEHSDSSSMLPPAEGFSIPEGMDPFMALSMMDPASRMQLLDTIREGMSQLPETILSQMSIAFVQAEYEAVGEDLDHLQMSFLMKAGLQMVLMSLLIMVCSISVCFLAARLAAGTGKDIRSAVYKKVVGFSFHEYHAFSTASLITRCTNDVQQVQMVTVMIFRIVLFAPILGAGGLLKILGTDVSMAWILGVGVTLILLLIVVLFKIAMPRFIILQSLVDRLNLVSREILTGIPVIRAFSREKHEEERFEKANADLTRTNLFVNRCMTFMMPCMTIIMNLISVMVIYVGSHAVDNGTIQVGNVMAFITYTMQVIMSFLMICMISIMLPRANVAGNRIAEVLHSETMILDPVSPKEPDPSAKGSLEFKNVSFTYPDAGAPVLKDISFSVHAGETLAIIGSTGSGKSSLMNLIPRFYDVSEGQILVDGVDVREMTQHRLRSLLGYVPQKGVLFSGDIRSNISYGCPELDEASILKSAEVAQAAEIIASKPDGLHHSISQGGTNVSGGQKQRLSIARAIAPRPEFYLFDDSFSALDFKTDAALRKALRDYTRKATTVIIAQRVSTIMNADQILVLDDGRMAGLGTHKQLLASCDVYRQIASSQLTEEELAI